MAPKKSSSQPKSSRVQHSQTGAVPARMVKASESAWSGSSALSRAKSPGLSKQRMLEARAGLNQVEREFIALTREYEADLAKQTADLEHQAAQMRAETWSIEQHAEAKAAVLLAQTRMEAQLADRIRSIAERSALAVLDRIKEASDSMMDWAGLIGRDMTDLLKKDAGQQAERIALEIKEIDEAIHEEERAAELLNLTGEYQHELNDFAA